MFQADGGRRDVLWEMKSDDHSFDLCRLVGCAGWSVPKDEMSHFPKLGSHLERYASVFPAVEINSSFYRPHRRSTYERWAASVREGFRFSVKVPKAITHDARLENIESPLDRFLSEATGLGDKLGCLLVQLPPSFAFERGVVESFLKVLHGRTKAPVAIEPRHISWFDKSAETLLGSYHIARVAADPALVPAAGEPGGSPVFSYYRLHGSPRTYYSAYSPATIASVAKRLVDASARREASWCIFDNTALGAATANAWSLLNELKDLA